MNINGSSYPPQLSFWEINQYLQDIDLLIVGSGIVGLTTAIFYKEKHPKAKVVIAEKGILPSGASTKNAGFACFGSPSEILADLKTSSENEVYQLIETRLKGLQALRKLVGDINLNYQPCGGFEVFKQEDETLFQQCLDFIPRANMELNTRLNLTSTYEIADNQIDDFGFSGIDHLIRNNYEGALDTGLMMNQLLTKASTLGVIILNSMEVATYAETNSVVNVAFENGYNLNCKQMHIATNGFALELLPELNIKPARAQVLITSEIENLKLNGTFHMNEGFYYFRQVGKRVLLGGGRELDFDGETSTKLETTSLIQNRLDEILRTNILSKSQYSVEHRWAGVMGVGNVKETIVKRVSERVSCSVRLGGMGVAIGTSIGKQSAELIG